jgi:hypothetical protein
VNSITTHVVQHIAARNAACSEIPIVRVVAHVLGVLRNTRRHAIDLTDQCSIGNKLGGLVSRKSTHPTATSVSYVSPKGQGPKTLPRGMSNSGTFIAAKCASTTPAKRQWRSALSRHTQQIPRIL